MEKIEYFTETTIDENAKSINVRNVIRDDIDDHIKKLLE